MFLHEEFVDLGMLKHYFKNISCPTVTSICLSL